MSNAVKTRWQAKRRLDEVHTITGVGREMHGAVVDSLESDQASLATGQCKIMCDAIGYDLTYARRLCLQMERRRLAQEAKRWSRAWLWGAWVLIAVFAVSVLYALSLGPAELWANNNGRPSDTRWRTVTEIYAPLHWVMRHCEWAANAEDWYLVKVCKSHY